MLRLSSGLANEFRWVSPDQGLAGWIRSDLPAEFLADFLRDPEPFFSAPSSRVLKHGTKIKVIKRIFFVQDGRELSVVIKRFRYTSFWRRLGFLFALSPARRCLRGAVLLRRHGIETASPLAALEDPRWQNFGTSYYIAEEIKEGRSLAAFWRGILPTLSVSKRTAIRREVLGSIASLFHQLHSRGVYHRDLKGSNILIQPAGREGWRSILVDVDRVRRMRGRDWSKRIKNLVQLYRTFGRRMSVKEKVLLLKLYGDLFPLSRQARKNLAQRVLALNRREEERRKRRQEAGKGQFHNGRISVLFVVGGIPYGGIENLLLDLLVHLDKGRFDFKVINLSGKGILTEKFSAKGVEVINLGFHLSTHRLDNTWRLRRLLIKLKPDVVFTSHFSANYHARLAAMGLGIKVITQVHNTKRERYWERRLADRLLGRIGTHRFVAVSKKVNEVLAARVPASRGKTALLYNAVSMDRLSLPAGYSREVFRRQEGIGAADFLVAAVGRLVYQKGFDVLLSAFCEVSSAVPEARLLIAGDGRMWTALKGLIEEFSLKGKVRLLGYRDDIPSLLCASDLFVMPSRWEGFGVAALEAIALGVPTILTDTSPIAELLTEGVKALVVPCESRAIARTIIGLARDQQARKSFSGSDRSTLPQEVDMRVYARRMEDLFLDVSQHKGDP